MPRNDKRIPQVVKSLEIVAGRWQVMKELGRGGFGAVYEVLDLKTRRLEAMKIEIKSQQFKTLKIEVYALRDLNEIKARHACKIYGQGTKNDYHYIVMTAVGPSINGLLSSMRPKFTNGRPHFTLRTSLFVGIQTLEALEELHKIGYESWNVSTILGYFFPLCDLNAQTLYLASFYSYIHRDVKPHNFAIGRAPNYRDIYLLDFGMCRKYVKKGKPRRPRQRVGFRGTLYYASVDALRGREQSRKDDVWSWAFMLVRVATGRVLWYKINLPKSLRTMVRARAYAECKVQVLGRLNEFLEGCPAEFKEIYEHLSVLTYYDKPNYDMCYKALKEVMKRMKYQEREPLDWEVTGEHHQETVLAPVHDMMPQKPKDEVTGSTPPEPNAETPEKKPAK
ncbi:unnamed protein product [Soboliphyme baturini]|uniref:Protein kinase domain-containing protein n=1 Tax=Soboliphyme baturini TaxID=241478 RepID=A0A183IN85_9BILA|nr:unnamed protein product [Soboliphyme baturini]